ncbi:MAG: hypothetical protein WAL98_11025 [Desulfatiglandaceae bacterium]|jgi:hypothetical protein
MKKKKKHKKNKPLSPSLCPEDKTLLESLLQACKTEAPKDILERIPTPEIAQALALSLPSGDETTLSLLLSLNKAFDRKDVQKAVKRALFKLKNKGIAVPDHLGVTPGPLLPFGAGKNEKPEGFVGPIDGTGTRGVFVSFPQAPSGYDAGIGVVNDETGFVEFHAAAYSKKRLKELKTHLFDEMGVRTPTSISHVLTILEKAYAKSQEASLNIPSDYLRLRNQALKNGSVLERPPIYELLPEPVAPREPASHSRLEKLFSHDTMQTWLIGPDEMEPLLLELDETEGGPLVLSEAQEQGRIQSIKERWAEKAFPESNLETLKYRLEEMAFVFHKRDEPEFGELALSAALLALEKTPLQSINPLVAFLLEKSLAFYEELRREAEGEDQIAKETSHPLILT